jgi:hypothetical protein
VPDVVAVLAPTKFNSDLFSHCCYLSIFFTYLVIDILIQVKIAWPIGSTSVVPGNVGVML